MMNNVCLGLWGRFAWMGFVALFVSGCIFNAGGSRSLSISSSRRSRSSDLRVDRSRLLIGAYCLQENARTDAHAKAISDCGVDFIVGTGKDGVMVSDWVTLDLFAKYGLGAIVDGAMPVWNGRDGRDAGKMRTLHPPKKYETAAKAFYDHPAIWGIDIGDEPSALDFPYFGELVRSLNGLLPGVPLYLNLYPNYASVAENSGSQTVSQLGTATYGEYIEAYCRYVPLDYISYDFYPYTEPERQDEFLSRMYDNFIVVSDACRKTGRSFWYIPQVNSRPGLQATSENRLRFQAFAAMSFGAEVIMWGCWCKGWWTNNVLDVAGQQTEQYGKLKRVNRGLKSMGGIYMKFRTEATHFVGFPRDSARNPKQPCRIVDALTTASFSGLRASNGAALLVGEMKPRNPSTKGQALFVTAADDPCDEHHNTFDLLFRVPKNVQAFGENDVIPIQRKADGCCSLQLSSCEAVLLVATNEE